MRVEPQQFSLAKEGKQQSVKLLIPCLKTCGGCYKKTSRGSTRIINDTNSIQGAISVPNDHPERIIDRLF